MRTLYQFSISHYCEKTRWQLDHKGLAYRVEHLFPGLHRLKTRRMAGTTSLPILRDGARVVADSTDIALYLEATYPQAPLLPPAGPLRDEILALEDRHDRLGVHVRRWLYGQIEDWASVTDAMLRVHRPLFGLRDRAKPMLVKGLRTLYGVTPERVAKSEAELLDGLEALEKRIHNDPSRYLVGDRLSLADISAAALYAPLLSPPDTPWADIGGFSTPAREVLDRIRERPAGQWILQRYRQDRPRATEQDEARA